MAEAVDSGLPHGRLVAHVSVTLIPERTLRHFVFAVVRVRK